MRVGELGVADVGEAVAHVVVPAVAELRDPDEGLRVVHLLEDDELHYVARVHVDGADGHDLLAVTSRQVADQHDDQVVQLDHLKS